MGVRDLVGMLSYVEPIGCALVLILLLARSQARRFSFLSAFLAVRAATGFLLGYLMYLAEHGEPWRKIYPIYFYVYWPSYLIQAILGFGIIYALFKMSMAPLQGLQRLGTLMFRWAGAIAIALAGSMALGPKMTSASFIQLFVKQAQQTESILTLCMLLFVCLASRPMGLSYRSKVFGISLGLGVMATADLVGSAWFSQPEMKSVYAIFNALSILATLTIWTSYFALPEPKRRMIVLPTTSPFLRWNQISLALGDDPGYVAVGDFTPDMFAPAEVEIMRRASVKMSATPAAAYMVEAS